MPRHVNGAHWPNARMWNIEQCLRAVGQQGMVTVLHIQLVDDPLINSHADDENCNTFGKLRHGFAPQGIPPAPERFIHIRCYHPNSLSLDPRQYAEHMVNLLANWKGSRDQAGLTANLWLDPFVGVSSGNEMNLHYENGQPDAGQQAAFQTVEHYQRIAAWDMAFWQRVDELVPNRKALRVSPAFADGHEPPGYPADGEYTIPDVRAMIEASDLVGIHPYALLHQNVQSGALGASRYWYMLRPFRPVGWEGPHDIGGVINQYPHKRFAVTECGTFTHSHRDKTSDTWMELDAFYWTCARSGKVIGATPFIWNSDSAHQDNAIWPNPELRGLMETAPRYGTTAELPVAGPVQPPSPPPPPTPAPDPVPDPGKRDAMKLLHPWPFYNQLDDWTTDADGTDENKIKNCGPECLAMCVKWATGVELPADFIKDAMRGPSYVGVTTLQELASFLTRRCEIPTQVVGPGDATTLLRPVAEASITQGYPVITLFSGNGADLAETVGHFMVVVGVDDAGAVCADPWGGKMRSLDWATFERLQRLGQALVVKRRRDDQLPAW